jgi:ribosome-associated protein
MIQITKDIAIDENEIQEDFVRASGPGGQNVNRWATAVQLRFDTVNSASLPQKVRQRLLCLGGKRVTKDGMLVIDARRFRTQERNRKDAIERLIGLVRRAVDQSKARRMTETPPESKRKRLKEKRWRAEIKRLRRPADSKENYMGNDHTICRYEYHLYAVVHFAMAAGIV